MPIITTFIVGRIALKARVPIVIMGAANSCSCPHFLSRRQPSRWLRVRARAVKTLENMHTVRKNEAELQRVTRSHAVTHGSW